VRERMGKRRRVKREGKRENRLSFLHCLPLLAHGRGGKGVRAARAAKSWGCGCVCACVHSFCSVLLRKMARTLTQMLHLLLLLCFLTEHSQRSAL